MTKIKFAIFIALFFFTQAAFAACTQTPTITGISPTHAPSSNGPNPQIIISGTNFTACTLLSINIPGFGTIPLPHAGITVTSTTITIAAGTFSSFPLPVGTVQITVRNGAGPSPLNPPFDYFTSTGDWQLFVLDDGGLNTEGQIYKIDVGNTATQQVAGSADFLGVQYLVMSPDGAYAYCLASSNTLVIVSVATGMEIMNSPIMLPTIDAIGMAVSPDGKILLISDAAQKMVYRFDVSDPTNISSTPTATYFTGTSSNPAHMAFMPGNNDLVYVASNNFVNEQIIVLDLATTMIGTYSTTTHASTFWIAPFPVSVNQLIYYQLVTLHNLSEGGDFASVYTDLQPGSTQVPTDVHGFRFSKFNLGQILTSPDSTRAYVPNDSSTGGAISIVTGLPYNTPGITDTVFTNLTDVHGLAITPDGRKGFATDSSFGNGNLSEFDTSTLIPTSIPLNTPSLGTLNFSAITPDQAPVAYAKVNSISGLTVSFDGTASLSPTGYVSPAINGIMTYDWDFGDLSPHGTGPTPTHTYASSGTYLVTLKVTNNAGTSTADTSKYFGQMAYSTGGPQAQFQFEVTVTPTVCDPTILPPSKVRIQQGFSMCRYRNTLVITPPTSGPIPTSYLICSGPNSKNVLQTVMANGRNQVKSKPIAAPCPRACYWVFSQFGGSVSCAFTKQCIN